MDENKSETGKTYWTDGLDHREIEQIRHATAYAATYAASGVPGHGQFLLIAKLTKMLDRYYTYIPEEPRVIRVAWSDEGSCWRDLMTGVKVEL
jgi:hypothetical protein